MEEEEVGGGGGGSEPAPPAPPPPTAATPSFCSPSITKALLRYWRECMEASRGSKAVHAATSARQPAF